MPLVSLSRSFTRSGDVVLSLAYTYVLDRCNDNGVGEVLVGTHAGSSRLKRHICSMTESLAIHMGSGRAYMDTCPVIMQDEELFLVEMRNNLAILVARWWLLSQERING